MEFDDEVDTFSETFEQIPEDTVIMDDLPAEYVPEIPDEERKSEAPPAVDSADGEDEKPPAEKKEEGEVDEVPKPNAEALAKELEALKEEKRKSDARAGYWQRQAEKDKGEPSQPEEPAVSDLVPPVKPNQDDFADYSEYEAAKDKYIEDLTDYKVEAKLREQESKKRQEAQADSQEAHQKWAREMMAEGVANFKDFEETVTHPTVPLTIPVLKAVRSCDKESVSHAEIVYFLGQDPKKTYEISRMTPDAMQREIGAIAEKIVSDKAKLSQSEPHPEPKPEPKRISTAPPPIAPVRGSSATVSKDPSKMTNDEYRAWRKGGGKG